MSISWGQGLLAGAAGVAEYSQQEQARRQKRLDRTTELQQQQRTMVAKSKYASRIKEYEGNRKVLQSLEGTAVGGQHEQTALYMGKGYTAKEANRMGAAASRGEVPKLSRPKAMKEPAFNIPAVKYGQARSPIGDWAASLSASYRTNEETPNQMTENPGQTMDRLTYEDLVGKPPEAVEEETALVNGEGTSSTANPLPELNGGAESIESVPTNPDAVSPLETPDKQDAPHYTNIEVPDPDNKDKVMTWEVASDPISGKELYRKPLKSRFNQEYEDAAKAKAEALGKPDKIDQINNSISIQEIDRAFMTGEDATELDYDEDAETPFNRSQPHFITSMTDGDIDMSDEQAITIAREMSLVSQAYMKANLSKIDEQELAQDPGKMITLQRQGEAFGILRTVPVRQIADALLNEDEELWSIPMSTFEGESARLLGPVITFLKKSRRPKEKALARKLNMMRARILKNGATAAPTHTF
jgi:hypothetical protein